MGEGGREGEWRREGSIRKFKDGRSERKIEIGSGGRIGRRKEG